MNYYNLSKYRKQLMGVSTLMILWLHFWASFNTPIGKVAILGSAGVDIFIILSGVGCYFSLKNKSTFVFYKNRFFRVVLPYLIMAIPLWFCIDYKTALKHISLYYFFNNGSDGTWFVPFILIFYLAFPLLYFIDNNKKIILYLLFVISIFLIVCIDMFAYETFSKQGIAIGRIPVALFSVLISSKVIEKKKIPYILIMCCLLLTVFKYYPFSFNNSIIYEYTLISARSFLYMLLIIFILSYIIKISFIDNALCYFGKYSFEIYILHTLIVRCIGTYFKRSGVFNFIVSVVLSLVISPFIKIISSKVTQKCV